MVFFVEHRAQLVLVEKVRTSAHAGVSCVPVCSTPARQMFFGGWRHRAWPPLPFRSALLPSSLLWCIRIFFERFPLLPDLRSFPLFVARSKTLLSHRSLGNKTCQTVLVFFFFPIPTIIITVIFNYFSLSVPQDNASWRSYFSALLCFKNYLIPIPELIPLSFLYETSVYLRFVYSTNRKNLK